MSRSARKNASSIPFLPAHAACVGAESLKKVVPKLDLSVLKALADPTHRYNYSTRSVTHAERDSEKESARNTYRPAIAPAWLKHDRQVLRFYAYFMEPVHENPRENYRIRQCTIYFYLEDGTVMVTEPKVENAGIPQGSFVKRHRIPKPRGQTCDPYYGCEDFRVGITIVIYARAFRIYECDEFTRAFYQEALGVTLNQGEDPPVDSFQSLDCEVTPFMASPRLRMLSEIREYTELAMGGSRKNGKLQQYLENDRKVLAFKCYYDDPTPYGARMYYTLHYHLADDSIEILENLARNSGRDPYPIFWRRTPLHKNPHISPAPGMLVPEPILYKPEDLVVGQAIVVYGRNIVMYDCDDFTRDFYLKYMGHEQGRIEIKNPPMVHVKLTHPPHTGFGADEDSLASCLRLTPRPPRQDVRRLLEDSNKVMRFEAHLVTGRTEDANRRFIVAVNVADKGVTVWETRQRNSGHAEGKFAQKSKKKNPATGTWFKPSDFYVGATLEINAAPFHLVKADEVTMRHMEQHTSEFPVAHAALTASKLTGLRDDLTQAGETISLEELAGLAEARLGVALVDHELISLARAFGEAGAADVERPPALLTARLLEAVR